MEKLELQYPLNLPFGMTQNFGENQLSLYKTQLSLNGHNGIDFSAKHGTSVYAAHDGEVTFAGEDGSAGLGVVIRTIKEFDYGTSKSYYKTIYWHLAHGSITVKASQIVKAGDKIGEADNTGLSTGDHLHFGLKPVYRGEESWQWWNAEQNNGYAGAIDPAPYFNGKYPKDKKVEIVDTFSDMMFAVRDYQVSRGLMDFVNVTDPKKINIGPKTLAAIAKDKK